jgi:hypothetical protein
MKIHMLKIIRFIAYQFIAPATQYKIMQEEKILRLKIKLKIISMIKYLLSRP